MGQRFLEIALRLTVKRWFFKERYMPDDLTRAVKETEDALVEMKAQMALLELQLDRAEEAEIEGNAAASSATHPLPSDPLS
jgi:hypothetical protein